MSTASGLQGPSSRGKHTGRPHHQQQQQANPFGPKGTFSGGNGVADAGDPFGSDDSDSGNDDGLESDDPTNTAMFLDDSEEKELDTVLPGTPQAFRKLGQLTVKSISRQKDSQTPGRTQARASAKQLSDRVGSSGREWRHANNVSPSKKGKHGDGADMLSTVGSLHMPGQVRSDPRPQREPNEPAVPLSVQRIRASQRASRILDNIKSSTPLFDARKSPEGGIAPLQFGKPGQYPRINLDPEFDKNEFSPIVFSKRRKSKQLPPAPRLEDLAREMPELDAVDGRTTPDNKPRLPAAGTPYRLLRALSEKSNESRITDGSQLQPPLRASADGRLMRQQRSPAANDPMRTPEKQPTINLLEDTPPSLPRERIDSLRKFFREHLGATDARKDVAADGKAATQMAAGGQSNNNLLIDFGSFDQQQSNEALAPLNTSTLSQISSIRHADGTMMSLLNSPSPLRPIKVPADNLDQHLLGAGSGHSPLLLSGNSGRDREKAPSEPAPFLLNQIWKQQQEQREQQAAAGGSSGNLIDLSSRLNMSIHALNNGLRGQLTQSGNGMPLMDQDELDSVARTVKMFGTELNQSLASLAPGHADYQAEWSPGRHGLSAVAESELEDQVRTLRDTMVETKDIVFSIQKELDRQKQGHSSENSKLDDIVRLLGALDMRLHMLEGRQRLDQTPQRANSGSVKVYAGSAPQQQDIVSRIGQAISYSLGRYPLMLIGALFIILLSELLVIGGFGSSVQTVRILGKHAFDEMKQRFVVVLPQPPS